MFLLQGWNCWETPTPSRARAPALRHGLRIGLGVDVPVGCRRRRSLSLREVGGYTGGGGGRDGGVWKAGVPSSVHEEEKLGIRQVVGEDASFRDWKATLNRFTIRFEDRMKPI